MDIAISRRGLLQSVAVGLTLTQTASARPLDKLRQKPGWVIGRLTGAQAVAEALVQEGVRCVYGIPGAQENELWDEFKARGVPYRLVTHEYSAACMADGYARATGAVGVLSVVPGPGATNALTGLGEALLDSVPIVALVGDVSNGPHAKPFQVHSLDNVALLRPVCKVVHRVECVEQIATIVRQAFRDAVSGEPGPVAVVIPYNLFIEVAEFNSPPVALAALPFDEAAFEKAVALLADGRCRVGIYAGGGCMDYCEPLTRAAELLQAPVATSVSGKGCIPESHPLAVGWGFGPHATTTAEKAFADVDTLLAVGVKFSEVSTGYYGNPKPKRVIHVDACGGNLGMVMPADVRVLADAGLFLAKLATCANLRRPADAHLTARIRKWKAEAEKAACTIPATKCGIDPLHLIRAIREHLPDDGLLFTDVTASEHLAAEHFGVNRPRSYFNPVDNQAMGWSLPAAIGAQKAFPGRALATLTGDGCFLMSATELATAARERLPVKFFILDDRAYHYMQALQKPAYRRTTATHLAKLDYRALAAGFGVGYIEATKPAELDGVVQSAMGYAGPVLVRIATDYGDRQIRWIEAVRKRFVKELTPVQKARFLARIAAREVHFRGDKGD